MASTEQSFEYARPPVRRAEFTLYFSPIRFDIALIALLQKKWADLYPAIAQRSPRPRPSAIVPGEFSGSIWPLPAVEQASQTFNPILAYQYDQISLAWTFESEPRDGHRYPGFQRLASELCDRFSELVGIVAARDGDNIVAQGASCYYTNSLPGDFTSADWVMGFLTNWTASGHRSRSDISAEYLSLKVHRQEENLRTGTRRSAWIELDEGDEQPGELDISSLSIPSEEFRGIASGAVEAARLLLDDAHSYEIHNFESSFSRETKEKWGIQ